MTTTVEAHNQSQARVHARIALAHDWLVGLRGGEWVLDRLAQLFGPTTIYTMMSDGRPLTPAIDTCTVVCSPLQRFPGASGRLRRWYLPLYPWAVEHLKVDSCDLLISTSSAAIKGIVPPPGVPHLCYCHSPARYLWEQAADYSHGAAARLRSAGLRTLRRRFQRWDRSASDRVTHFLANSAHTADKIRRYYDREAAVLYPPVRTTYFLADESVPREDFYLVVSALEPYKRVDLAIEAAKSAGIRLVVAGSGSQARALRSLANERIEMVGRVDDDELRNLYRRARALIYPQLEDFGIIAVEAQACGCPVIAYAAGGALETVSPQTGILFDEQSSGALADAIGAFENASISSASCRANAVRFSETAFDSALIKAAERLLF